MNLLLIPTSDWTHHPTKSRLHYIFENLSRRHRVNVLWLKQSRWKTVGRKTGVILHDATRFHSRDLSSYFLLNTPFHFRRISSLIKSEDIDIIVFANILAGSVAVNAASMYGVPIVCDYLDHYPESASAYYSNQAIKRITAKGVSLIMGWNVRNSTANVTISDTFKSILVEDYRVSPERVFIIPNGVDTTTFVPIGQDVARRRLGLEKLDRFLWLCYVGAVEAWSNLEVVTHTVERLNRDGYKVAFIIVGGGLGTRYYQDLLSTFGNREYLLFTGFVDPKQVALYMCASDVCILPSKVAKISAGLPLKLLEYLACKKPVLITPIQEVLNCLRNVVAIYHDPQELYDILKRMCEGKIQKTSSIEEGYRFALSRSWDNISRDYERLLINTFSGR